MGDPQLAAAVRAVLGKQATNNWPKVGQSNAAMLARATKRETLSSQRDLLKQRLTEIEASLAKLDAPATQPATPGAKDLTGGAIVVENKAPATTQPEPAK
ncbi:MAG: hypothetical protein NTW19_04310 [Planctomycetota bacterium]|nr:hypothetical protein [Planctomycetota bacterium]